MREKRVGVEGGGGERRGWDVREEEVREEGGGGERGGGGK